MLPLQEEEGCSIYYIPVIDVCKAKACVFVKCSVADGNADIDKCSFDDVKTSCGSLDGKHKEAFQVTHDRVRCSGHHGSNAGDDA